MYAPTNVLIAGDKRVLDMTSAQSASSRRNPRYLPFMKLSLQAFDTILVVRRINAQRSALELAWGEPVPAIHKHTSKTGCKRQELGLDYTFWTVRWDTCTTTFRESTNGMVLAPRTGRDGIHTIDNLERAGDTITIHRGRGRVGER